MSELIQFKNKHNGKKVILFGPGPTLNNFNDNLGEEYIRVAVSGTIFHSEIRDKIQYWIWAGDYLDASMTTRTYDRILETIPKVNKNIIKFVNCWTNNSRTFFSHQCTIDPDLAKQYGFYRYNQISGKFGGGSDGYGVSDGWYKNLDEITSGPSAYSACFHAMQILLYMGFTEIVLVGFDCGGGHSYKHMYQNDFGYSNGLHKRLIGYWNQFSKWVKKEYPIVNIKVVNPVGLKNIFTEYI